MAGKKHVDALKTFDTIYVITLGGPGTSSETINILLEGIVDTCLCGILFWAWGFAFMFGAGNGFIGKQYFMLHGAVQHALYHAGQIAILKKAPRK